MSNEKRYLAVDLGAESGRVMIGTVGSEKLSLEEVHRFPNGPTEENGSLRWDFSKLFGQIKEGLGKAIAQCGGSVAGIGVDTWGVDFGLLDEKGALVENPYHYRDTRTDEMMERAFEIMPKRELYEQTGIQFMQFNTVFQLLAAKQKTPQVLQKARNAIMMADLVSYYLCGEVFAEYTLASTGQLVDMRTGQWSQAVFEALGLPVNLMPRLVQAGTIVGHVQPEIVGEYRGAPIPVIAVGSHDTASAVAAVPAQDDNWLYLSSGTWSLLGAEIPEPAINDVTFEYQFTNEGGVQNTIRLLKNIMGLWLVQECRRSWQNEGQDYSYAELTEMARQAPAFASMLNPNDTGFLAPGNMPQRINEYLKKIGKQPLEDKGQMIRTILEGLAFNYRWVIEKIEGVLGKKMDVLHIVGGGIQNTLLCQFAAEATGKRVIAGPIEATASGNILMQAIADGQVHSLTQGRRIVANSFDVTEYHPQDTSQWNRTYQEFIKIFTP